MASLRGSRLRQIEKLAAVCRFSTTELRLFVGTCRHAGGTRSWLSYLHPERQSMRSVSSQIAASKFLLLIAVVFYGFCFLHLRADFPNYSPWNDWSKMTDEGWYGGA